MTPEHIRPKFFIMPDNPKSWFRRFQIEFQTRLGQDVANLKLRLDVADDGLDEVVVDAVVVERLVVGRQDPVFVFGHPDGLEVRLVGAGAAVNHGFEDSPKNIKNQMPATSQRVPLIRSSDQKLQQVFFLEHFDCYDPKTYLK